MRARDAKGRFTAAQKNEKRRENMKTITIKTITVNGYSETTYNDLPYISNALAKLFNDQGAFYSEVLGVNWDDASKARWYPEDKLFYTGNNGWERMLSCGGKITKTETVETVSVYDVVFPKA